MTWFLGWTVECFSVVVCCDLDCGVVCCGLLFCINKIYRLCHGKISWKSKNGCGGSTRLDDRGVDHARGSGKFDQAKSKSGLCKCIHLYGWLWNFVWIYQNVQPSGADLVDEGIDLLGSEGRELIDLEVAESGQEEKDRNLSDAIGVGVGVCVVVSHYSGSPLHFKVTVPPKAKLPVGTSRALNPGV